MSVRDVPVQDFRDALDDDAQFVDVREPGEFAAGSLPGAINIPLGDLPDMLPVLDPSRRIVLLCRSGNRSGQAARFLAAEGFPDVINLAGGLLAYGGA